MMTKTASYPLVLSGSSERKSVVTTYQQMSGIACDCSLPAGRARTSLLVGQSLHVATYVSTSLYIPGQYTYLEQELYVLSSPRCPIS